MSALWSFIRPNFIKIMLLIMLVAITSFMITRHEATSKVSWLENRGAPVGYVSLAGYEGPCPPDPFCKKITITNTYIYAILIDTALWYLVSCVIFLVYQVLKRG